ncbi:MAG: STAS domain-containing protein [Candidatus Hydrogenedentes bacterium]|nr:STAS domain-containing protein [Candidatus Hydrogenedentota bacterium]
MDNGRILFARYRGLVVLKLVGEIRYTVKGSYRVSVSFDAFLDKLFEERDFKNVLIDLTETTGIDSTNIGLLAKIARFTMDNFGQKPTIISTNDDINRILDSVGFDQVFVILHEPHNFDQELEELPEMTVPDKELARLILDAHKALIELNEKNKNMFKNVVDVMEQSLRDKK